MAPFGLDPTTQTLATASAARRPPVETGLEFLLVSSWGRAGPGVGADGRAERENKQESGEKSTRQMKVRGILTNARFPSLSSTLHTPSENEMWETRRPEPGRPAG